MDLILVNVVPLTGLWLAFFAGWPSFRTCDGSGAGCSRKFRFRYFSCLLFLTGLFSVLTVFANGSLASINGRFMAESSREEIVKQLSESADKLNQGEDPILELDHIRRAMDFELSDVARWRNEVPKSQELKDLEERVKKLCSALDKAVPETLEDTLSKEREKLLK